MKKTNFFLTGLAAITLTACGSLGSSTTGSTGGSILGDIIGATVNGETIGNAIGSVLGLDKVQENALYGTWSYNGPGCASTSENALAKAGGEVAATEVRQKLKTQYDKLGFTRSNTWITLNKDHSFSAKIDGKSFNGTFTFDQQNQQLKLNGLLLNLTAYTKRTTTGMAVLFESKKILSLLQTLATMSGNSTATVIGDISKNYDGVRIGFDLKK